MSDVSPELNLPPPKRDQIRSVNNADKSLKVRLKRGVGKVILGTPLAALLISSGSIDNPNVPNPNIKESIPASAPLPENTTHNTDILQPYTPQSATEIPPTVTQSPLATHTLEQGVNIEDYVQQKLTSALEKASLELEHAGIDFEEEVTLDEIKQITKEAIPYLAEELNIERVHTPSIRSCKF